MVVIFIDHVLFLRCLLDYSYLVLLILVVDLTGAGLVLGEYERDIFV